MRVERASIVNLLGWAGPFLLFGLALVVLQFRTGLWSKPPQQQEWVEAKDIAETVPIAALRSAVEQAGYEWSTETNTLLLFAIGVKVCFGCLVEIDEFMNVVRTNFTGATNGDRITPLVLFLSDSLPTAKRFAKVAELSATTIPTSDPDLLETFGFREGQASRQIAVLIDSQNGRVVRHAFVSSTPTSIDSKLAFLNLNR